MVQYLFKIPIPKFLDLAITAPLLLLRRVWYGYTFRRLKIENINKYTIVDVADFYRFSKNRWFCRKPNREHGVVRFLIASDGSMQTLYIHREIMKQAVGREEWNKKKKNVIDHINRISFDNRRSNLRFATQIQNMRNSSSRKSCSSKYKGVHYIKSEKQWRARIKVNGKRKYLGRFKDEEEAARAYDKAAKKYFKEFACLNFPPPLKQKGLRNKIKHLLDLAGRVRQVYNLPKITNRGVCRLCRQKPFTPQKT